MKTFEVSFDLNGEHYTAKVVADNENDAALKVGFYQAITWATGMPLLNDNDFTFMSPSLTGEVQNTAVKEV